MNRPLTALFAALEALLVIGVGIGIPLVPLTLMWAIQYGLQVDWIVFWRGSVDAWALGHGADMRFVLDPAIAAATALPGAGDPFTVTIAPLGFALITVLLAVRAGRRIGETPHHRLGRLTAIGVFAVLAFVLTLSAEHPAADPSLAQGTLLPTAVFALGIAVGAEISRRRLRRAGKDDAGGGIRSSLERRLPRATVLAGVAVSGGAAAAMTVIAISAVALAVIVALDYGELIALYQGVQSGYLGGAALTVGQLAILPNLVIFTASWFVGPGFAIGTGSAVSPLGTALGPLPAIPVLGALPTGDSAFAYAGLLVPVLAGFLAGILIRPRLVRSGLDGMGGVIGAGAAVGIVGGLVLGALAWVSAGSAGPGRLVEVGPPWLLVGAWAALEIGLPAVIALIVAGRSAVRSDGVVRSDGAAQSEDITRSKDIARSEETTRSEDTAGPDAAAEPADGPHSVVATEQVYRPGADVATGPIPVQYGADDATGPISVQYGVGGTRDEATEPRR